jgi:hypothetical protein
MQSSTQLIYITICSLNGNKCDILHSSSFTVLHFEEHYSTKPKCALIAYCPFIILLYLTAYKVIFIKGLSLIDSLFVDLFKYKQGLKFTVSRYPQDNKNVVLDTKLWTILSRLDTKKISNIKKMLNTFDGLLIVLVLNIISLPPVFSHWGLAYRSLLKDYVDFQ